MTKQDDDNGNSGRFLGIGLEIAVGVGFGVVVGLWVDKRFGWSPAGVITGSMLGLAAGMYLMIKEVMRSNKD